MAKKALAFVDSCVLLDVFNDDEQWGDWSYKTLNTTSKQYNLVINIIVFTEIAFNFDSYEQLEQALHSLRIQVLQMPNQAAFNVSRVFKQYRKNRGTKNTPMPDFYIGEHADYLNIPLITRDVARYKTYHPDVKLISPDTC